MSLRMKNVEVRGHLNSKRALDVGQIWFAKLIGYPTTVSKVEVREIYNNKIVRLEETGDLTGFGNAAYYLIEDVNFIELISP